MPNHVHLVVVPEEDSLSRLFRRVHRHYTSTHWSAGDEVFECQLESLTGRELHKKKPGPKREVR